jgi:hypothetical protein
MNKMADSGIEEQQAQEEGYRVVKDVSITPKKEGEPTLTEKPVIQGYTKTDKVCPGCQSPLYLEEGVEGELFDPANPDDDEHPIEGDSFRCFKCWAGVALPKYKDKELERAVREAIELGWTEEELVDLTRDRIIEIETKNLKKCPDCNQILDNLSADDGDRSYIRGRECNACDYKEGDV